MSLRYALLGFLNLGPMTGYDLKKQLDRSTQSFWHAGLNQIYPTLKKMDDEGWITSAVEPQEARPDRVVYRMSDTGRQEMLEWLAQPMTELARGRHPGLLKLFFAGYLSREEALDQLRAQLELHQAELASHEGTREVIAAVAAEEPRLHRPAVFWELVRDLGEKNERMYIDWLEGAIEIVRGME
jgi:DNA-binding PadR family transcriptional regulator